MTARKQSKVTTDVEWELSQEPSASARETQPSWPLHPVRHNATPIAQPPSGHEQIHVYFFKPDLLENGEILSVLPRLRRNLGLILTFSDT